MKFAYALFVVIFSSFAQAAPTFNNITKSDLETIAEDFGAVFVHTSVSPAASLGKEYGFELGLLAGEAQVPGVEELVKKADPNSDQVSMIPHLGILAAITIPGALTLEVVMLPPIPISDLSLKYKSAAVKWTMTDTFISLPVDVALKVHYAAAKLGFKQDVNSVETDVEVEENILGLAVIVSKKMIILEPYYGIGLLSADSSASLSGTEEFFTFTDAQSASADPMGLQLFAGLNVNFVNMKFGFEAGRVFESNKASAKVSFYF